MKRYFLFGFDQFYPGGGMGDFEGDFDTFEAMIDFVKNEEYPDCHYQALDTVERKLFDYNDESEVFSVCQRQI